MLTVIKSIFDGVATIANFFHSISEWCIHMLSEFLDAAKFIFHALTQIDQYLGAVFLNPYIVSMLAVSIGFLVLMRIVGWN